MKPSSLFLAIPIFGFACGQPSKPHIEPGQYLRTIKEAALERTYILRVPTGYDNRTNLPVVILFHGWTGSAERILAATGFGAKADKEGFILVVPNGTEGIGKWRGWNCGFLNLGNADADDIKFTSDILDQVEKDLHVDENRVYVAGHSNGAMMAYDLGAKMGDRLAAIAVVSGTVGVPNAHVPDPVSPLSAIIFHGKADDTVPYDDKTQGLIKSTPAPESAKWWAEKDGCKAAIETTRDRGNLVIEDYEVGKNHTEVEFFTIVDGDHAWPGSPSARSHVPATDLIWSFFKSHPRRK